MFSIYSGYLCVVLKFVYWQNQRNHEGGKYFFTALKSHGDVLQTIFYPLSHLSHVYKSKCKKHAAKKEDVLIFKCKPTDDDQTD